MTDHAHVDFETCSELDLRKVGVYRYAEHSSTRILCMSWQMPGSSGTWFPDEPLPRELMRWGGMLSAWNAQFERVIWAMIGVPRHGFSLVSDDRWYNPQALAMSRNLPASLIGTGQALGAEVLKDKPARKLMLNAARGNPVDMDALGRYCATDVAAERSIHVKLGQRWEQRERIIYRVSERINDRGIAIDLDFVRKAAHAVEQYQRHVAHQMESAFGISPAQVQRIREVCLKRYRVELPDLRADTVDEILAAPDFYPDEMCTMLRMRQQAAAVSVKKYAAMLRSVCFDDRIRGMFSYCGAGQTRRWSARIVQPQNLPRPTLPYEVTRAAMEALRASGRWEDLLPFGDPLEVLLNAIRPSLLPGYTPVLTAGDESAIEARVLPWLAGDKDTLDIFRDGGDVYLHAAESIYHRALTEADKPERQIGKVATLSLGYQGGKDAFRTLGRNYGVYVSPEEAEGIKFAWREAHPKIVAFWYALQDAAIGAIQRHGTEYRVGPLSFRHTGSMLWMRLPSGGALCYPRAHLRMTTPQWEMAKPEELRKQRLTIAFYAPFGDNMVLDFTYGGKLAENATQAVARDVIGEALIREPDLDYVLHAHDELVTEGDTTKRLDLALTAPIAWIPGLPLKADVHTMDRYHKED